MHGVCGMLFLFVDFIFLYSLSAVLHFPLSCRWVRQCIYDAGSSATRPPVCRLDWCRTPFAGCTKGWMHMNGARCSIGAYNTCTISTR